MNSNGAANNPTKPELQLSAIADRSDMNLEKEEEDVCIAVAADVRNKVSFDVSGTGRSIRIGRVCWVGGWAVLDFWVEVKGVWFFL